jgi:hypothetical protein
LAAFGYVRHFSIRLFSNVRDLAATSSLHYQFLNALGANELAFKSSRRERISLGSGHRMVAQATNKRGVPPRLEFSGYRGSSLSRLRADLGIIGRYRLAEQILTRGLRPLIGKPGQASAPVGQRLNQHANECARIVLDTGKLGKATHDHAIHELAVVEAFPTSFLGVLIEKPSELLTRRGNL